MTKYNVKVNLSIHYDQNFEVEAKDEKEAEQKAKDFGWNIAYLAAKDHWTFLASDVVIAYVEEA